MSKTNAMRILDSLKINYNTLGYNIDDGKVDGMSVSKKINRPYDRVFKTLVTKSSQNIYVFIIPVDKELDFKKAAKLAQEKKIEMVHVNDILKLTGYIRGGCSPIGMKKNYPSFIHETARDLPEIVISAGKIGSQIEISLDNLEKAMDIKTGDLTKN